MPSRSELKWSQLKVGIVVAVSALILIILIFAITGEMGIFQHKIHLITYVANSGSLLTGATVSLEGVRIGSVANIQLSTNPPDPTSPIRVDMKVADKYPRWLRQDSTVELGTANPLGEMLVTIHYGTLKSPPAKDGTVLKAATGAGISALLVSTHSLLQNLNEIVGKVGTIVDQISNGQGTLGKLIYSEEMYNRFNDIAMNVQSLTQTVARGRGTIGQLLNNDSLYRKVDTTVDNLNRLLDQVQNGNGSLSRLMRDPELYNNANDIVRNLRETTASLNAGRGTAGLLLRDQALANRLRDTVNRLNSMVASIDQGKGTIGKMVKDPALYNNANGLVLDLRGLMRDIHANPKKYLTIHLKIF